MDKESRPASKKQLWPAHQIAEAFAEQQRELFRLRRLHASLEVRSLNVKEEIHAAEKRLVSITEDLAAAIQVRAIAALPARNEVSS